MAIARDQIVEEALRLLDEVGIDGLTTRKLADRLGVQQPALYWHFRNKRALLDAMNEAMLEPYRDTGLPLPGETWRAFLGRYATGLRDALRAHRQGALVHAGAPPSDGDDDRMRVRQRFLIEAGFSATLAIEAAMSLHHYVMGNVMDEQADREAGIGWDGLEEAGIDGAGDPFMDALLAMGRLGRDGVYRSGLEMVLDGIALRLRAEQARSD